MGLALVVVLILPLLHRSIKRSLHNDWLFIIPFWFLVIDVCLLGWLGACPVQEPYVTISQIGTVYYFFFFLVWMPFLKRI
jgi:ubiquinol-cytochrome c reductase cytochrome b subunit